MAGTQTFRGEKRTIITTNATTQIKTARGRLCRLLVSDAGTGWTIDIYDHASGNSNQVWQHVTADGKAALALDISMENGIRVVTSGTTPGRAVVTWS